MDEVTPVDPAIFADLSREAPVLSSLKRFAGSLERIPWFAGLGTPPTRQVRDAAERYLDRLGFPDAGLAIVRTYEDAADAAETHDWASPSWEAEELMRADLTARALTVMSEEALDIGLRLVAEASGAAARDGAMEQAALWDMADEAALNLAVGGAVQGANAMALVLCAAADGTEEDTGDHAAVHKFRLFELGRWPIAVVGSSFNVF